MSPERRGDGLVTAALVLAVLAVLGQAWQHASHFVDDAYIGFRYAANFAAGHGLTWHPGAPPVEGVTNLGWVLVLAVASSLGSLPAVAKAVGLLALLGTLGLATLLHPRLAPTAGWGERAALPVLLAAQPELVYFAVAGMETGFTAVWCLLAVTFALDWERRPATVGAGLGLVAGVLFLLRPELALVPVFFVALRGLGGDRRGLGTFGAVAAAVLLLVTLGRLSEFGAPLPNTFAAKAPGSLLDLAGRTLLAPIGGLDNLPAPFGLGLAIVALGAYRLRGPARAAGDLAIAFVLAGIAFAIYARPDWTGLGRYFGPLVPLAVIFLLRGTALLAARVTPRHTSLATAAVAVVLAGHGAVRHARHLTGAALEVLPGLALVSESLVEPARQIDEIVPPDTTVACRRIGVLGWSLEARVFDFAYGLTEPDVARQLRATRRGWFDNARNPALAEVWRRVEPDYLVEDWTRLETWFVGSEDARRFRIHGVPYEVIATWPIAEGQERWALARRLASVPVSEGDDWRAAADRRGPRDPLR